MLVSSHRIEVYEPFEYIGPNPLILNSIGVLKTPDKKDAHLFLLTRAIVIEGHSYDQLVVRPKFLDPIERVVESNCTVMISLVRPDRLIEAGGEYCYADVLNWGVGKINQCRPTSQTSGAL